MRFHGVVGDHARMRRWRAGYYQYVGASGEEDHIEAFHIERDSAATDRVAMRLPYFLARGWPESMFMEETKQGNRWPTTLARPGSPTSEFSFASLSAQDDAGADAVLFRSTMNRYFAACDAACGVIMTALARGLGLPPDVFTRMHSFGDGQLEVKRYPRAVVPGVERLSDHRDQSSVTLLAQDRHDRVGGLEIWDRSREVWVAAPSRPGLLLVNTGDFMSRWTNGRLLSTRHRVVPPDMAETRPGTAAGGGAGDCTRLSAVYFCTPDWHAPVAPVEPRIGADPRAACGDTDDVDMVGDLLPGI